MKTVCICGGGALGHVLCAVFSNKGYKVNLLTNHPQSWESTVVVRSVDKRTYIAHLSTISNNPKDVIPNADIIFLCLPGFLIAEQLKQIKPYLANDAIIGSVVSSTGFFIMALDILGDSAKLFGFQRVPYISRVSKYGKEACILGYKKELKIACHRIVDVDSFRLGLEEVLGTPILLLRHLLEATLTNSNPILHPTRLYCLFSSNASYKKEIYFYEEWNLQSSQMLIACDEEFQNIIRKLPLNHNEMPSILDYYESTDEYSLTEKIKSIQAFKGIIAPMKKEGDLYVPDFSSRYFTEDIPYGLVLLKYIGSLLNVSTPHIDEIIEWSQNVLELDLLHDGLLEGKDIFSIGCLRSNVIISLI
jgi:hypothetical protein